MKNVEQMEKRFIRPDTFKHLRIQVCTILTEFSDVPNPCLKTVSFENQAAVQNKEKTKDTQSM